VSATELIGASEITLVTPILRPARTAQWRGGVVWLILRTMDAHTHARNWFVDSTSVECWRKYPPCQGLQRVTAGQILVGAGQQPAHGVGAQVAMPFNVFTDVRV
jgi:hypothetical protein